MYDEELPESFTAVACVRELLSLTCRRLLFSATAAGSVSLPAGQLAAVLGEDVTDGLAGECFLEVHQMLLSG